MPLNLPPLNALRAFEAAARTGSYVAAAKELGVSPAAVSQHIRKLEEYLGKQMFMRLNNRVVLTDAGSRVFAGTADALALISDTTGQLLSDRSKSRLVISSIESVAEKWLLPRLIALSQTRPGFRFDLLVDPDPVDFARHNIDLRLCYGASHYPDLTTIPLVQDVVLPLCSPAYLARNAGLTMANVPDDALLHTQWGPSFGSHPTWANWFHKAGLRQPTEKGPQIGRSSLVLDMARAGLGVALGQRLMAAEDIAAGLLIPLSEVTIPLGQPYCLVHPKTKARKKELLSLIDWLVTAAKA